MVQRQTAAEVRSEFEAWNATWGPPVHPETSRERLPDLLPYPLPRRWLLGTMRDVLSRLGTVHIYISTRDGTVHSIVETAAGWVYLPLVDEESWESFTVGTRLVLLEEALRGNPVLSDLGDVLLWILSNRPGLTLLRQHQPIRLVTAVLRGLPEEQRRAALTWLVLAHPGSAARQVAAALALVAS